MSRSIPSSLATLLATVVVAQAGDSNPMREAEMAVAVSPSLVRVEYTFRYDKGEEPAGGGWQYRCPNCGRWHSSNDSEKFVEEERPLEAPGYLLSKTEVITRDLMMHPRFIEKIQVRFGNEVVDATPAARAEEQVATILQLASPLSGARPLVFDSKAEPPYMTVGHAQQNAVWTTTVQKLSTKTVTTDRGRRFRAAPSYCLIVGGDGTPVGMSMNDELPLDDAWKVSPLSWDWVPASEMKSALSELRTASARGLVRVALSFRSPKKRQGRSDVRFQMDDDYGTTGTERNVVGVLLPGNRVLVISSMKPAATALLERITVYPPEGDPVQAKFLYSLKEYGCLIVETETPVEGALALSRDDILDFRNKLLLGAEVRIQGEKRVVYFSHYRIASYERRWKRQVYPEVAGDDENLFLCRRDGTLLALPLTHREKVSQRERWSSGGSAVAVPAACVLDILDDIQNHIDLSNVPLSEEEENRIAWLGVSLQALDQDLARANNVSDLTKDGQVGALVSYVYAESPGAKAGVEVGDILLRLHVDGEPNPYEVEIEDEGFRYDSFPWEQLDQIPEDYYDQIPAPWPSVENTLTRALSDMGFGKKYRAEFFRDGKVIEKPFTIVQSPPHYVSAPRHKWEEMGLTVCDLTFEVRRYLQKADDDPGVVISKLEPGSKASVAGIKPFELITHVNDVPVYGAKEFGEAVASGREFRLAVKRMTRGRIVKLKASKKGKDEKDEADTGESQGVKDMPVDDTEAAAETELEGSAPAGPEGS